MQGFRVCFFSSVILCDMCIWCVYRLFVRSVGIVRSRTKSHGVCLFVYRLFVGKPEGKEPLGRSRRRWMDNIKMDLLDIGLNFVDWIGLAQ
jgi:hypothetical protein